MGAVRRVGRGATGGGATGPGRHATPLSLSSQKKRTGEANKKCEEWGGRLPCLPCLFFLFTQAFQASRVCSLVRGVASPGPLSPAPPLSSLSACVCELAWPRPRPGRPPRHARPLSLPRHTHAHAHAGLCLCPQSEGPCTGAASLRACASSPPSGAGPHSPVPKPLLLNESGTGRRPVSGGQSSSSIALFYTGREAPGHALGWWWVLGREVVGSAWGQSPQAVSARARGPASSRGKAGAHSPTTLLTLLFSPPPQTPPSECPSLWESGAPRPRPPIARVGRPAGAGAGGRRGGMVG